MRRSAICPLALHTYCTPRSRVWVSAPSLVCTMLRWIPLLLATTCKTIPPPPLYPISSAPHSRLAVIWAYTWTVLRVHNVHTILCEWARYRFGKDSWSFLLCNMLLCNKAENSFSRVISQWIIKPQPATCTQIYKCKVVNLSFACKTS
jgi:hypothetical protein